MLLSIKGLRIKLLNKNKPSFISFLQRDSRKIMLFSGAVMVKKTLYLISNMQYTFTSLYWNNNLFRKINTVPY